MNKITKYCSRLASSIIQHYNSRVKLDALRNSYLWYKCAKQATAIECETCNMSQQKANAAITQVAIACVHVHHKLFLQQLYITIKYQILNFFEKIKTCSPNMGMLNENGKGFIQKNYSVARKLKSNIAVSQHDRHFLLRIRKKSEKFIFLH